MAREIFGAVMTQQPSPAPASRAAQPRRREAEADLSLAVCLGLVVAQTCFRAWALLPSWFYTDDYRLLLQANATPLTLDAVLAPFDSQFMPAGRLISYLVLGGGELNWNLAAVITLALSTSASLACLYMLVTLFGRGWPTAALLSLYLTTTLTVPAMMWWAASLNQIAPQACFFLAITWWVTYIRTRQTRHGVAAIAAVVVALAFYVKALLIPVVLAYLTVVVFSHGPWKGRVVQAWRSHWRLVLPTLVAAVSFLAWYATSVEQAYAGSDASQMGQVADSMLGRAMPTGLLGGPWQWWNTTPPIVIADPPGWTVHVSWVVLALAIAYTVLRRSGAWTGWLLIACYGLLDFALLATSRGQQYGVFAGLDYRYLTDLAPVAVLGVGLATMSVRDLGGGSAERAQPLMVVAVPQSVLVVGTALVCIGGTVSSIGYIHFWHHENTGATYVRNLQSDLGGDETHDLVNQTMPAPVMPGYTDPYNRTEAFVELVRGDVRFPDVSADLELLDEAGHLVRATVQPWIRSEPGPREGCGWLVRHDTADVPMESTAFGLGRWAEINYLAAADTTLDVTMGGTTRSVPFQRGLGSVMLRVTEQFDSVTLEPTGDDVAVCIDSVQVGEVRPE